MVELKDPEGVLNGMRSRVREQGNIVRALKSSNASTTEINVALAELKVRKKMLEDKEMELSPQIQSFDRGKLEDLLKQRFFYDQAFSIYGGIQGLYDYGPMGCSMKANLLSIWRQHFVIEDQLLEVDCSMLTPAPVLQASGHVERFTDLMVKDVQTGDCFRADHLVKSSLETKMKNKKTTDSEKEEICKILLQLDNLSADELDAIIRKYDMKSPTTNNALSEPQEFNLMFSTLIGPSGQYKGYLRPETAQGIFVNFQRLLQFNQGRIPFGAAQIGPAFRNEISPRSGLIRVREFVMAEIEYFVDPGNKRHPKFAQVRDTEMTLYSACAQMDGLPPRVMTIGQAVDEGTVANETLGYFMARIHSFLLVVGVNAGRLRFRQHLSNEMAHYASDCWDAECHTSYGWIECVGCADRSCFDLTQHAKATGARLVAEKRLPEPLPVQVCKCVPNKQALGKAFRGEAKSVAEHLALLGTNETRSLKEELHITGQAELSIGGKQYLIDTSMVDIKEFDDKIHVEEFTPNVIEPSFGIGRILYVLFEHSFRVRDGDEQRTYLSVPPILAPYKCSVLPLSSHPSFTPFVAQLSAALTRLGVTHRVDDSSGSIGRRYARTDQIAIPYGITVDFDTVNKSPASATLRERDTMGQIRVPLDELPSLVNNLSNGLMAWSDAQSKYPLFEQQDTAPREVEDFNSVAEVKHRTSPELNVNKPYVLAPPWLSSMKQAKDKQLKGTTGKTLTDDEWRGFSNKLANLDKNADPETDDWSSATETAENNLSPTTPQYINKASEDLDSPTMVKPIQLPIEPVESGSDHYEEPLKAFDAVDATVKPENNAITVGSENQGKHTVKHVQKRPLSWTDWGKAIRRFYQEEELKEKSAQQKSLSDLGHFASASHSIEPDETPSSFSGYEADQEDNVTNKSTDSFFPSVNDHHQDTIMTEPKPTGADVGDTSLPILSGNDPHHGLFAGHGWSETTSKQHTKSGAIPVTQHTKPPKQPKETRIKEAVKSTPSQPETTEANEWPDIMARILEKSNEPEMWQMQLDSGPMRLNDFTESQNSQLCASAEPQPTSDSTAERKDPFGDTLNTVDQTADHGLFKGTGWPKHSKDEKNDRSSHAKTKEPKNNDMIMRTRTEKAKAHNGSPFDTSSSGSVDLFTKPGITDGRSSASPHLSDGPQSIDHRNDLATDVFVPFELNHQCDNLLAQAVDTSHSPDLADSEMHGGEDVGLPIEYGLGDGVPLTEALDTSPKAVDPWVDLSEQKDLNLVDLSDHNEPAPAVNDAYLDEQGNVHTPTLSSESIKSHQKQVPTDVLAIAQNQSNTPDHISAPSEPVTDQAQGDSLKKEELVPDTGSHEEGTTATVNKPKASKCKRRKTKRKKK